MSSGDFRSLHEERHKGTGPPTTNKFITTSQHKTSFNEDSDGHPPVTVLDRWKDAAKTLQLPAKDRCLHPAQQPDDGQRVCKLPTGGNLVSGTKSEGREVTSRGDKFLFT